MKLENGEYIVINGTHQCTLCNDINKDGDTYYTSFHPYTPEDKERQIVNFLTLFGITKKYKNITGTRYVKNQEEKLAFMKEVLTMFNELFVSRKDRFSHVEIHKDNDELYMDITITNNELLDCIDKTRVASSPRFTKQSNCYVITGDYCLDVVFDAIETLLLNKRNEKNTTL